MLKQFSIISSHINKEIYFAYFNSKPMTQFQFSNMLNKAEKFQIFKHLITKLFLAQGELLTCNKWVCQRGKSQKWEDRDPQRTSLTFVLLKSIYKSIVYEIQMHFKFYSFTFIQFYSGHSDYRIVYCTNDNIQSKLVNQTWDYVHIIRCWKDSNIEKKINTLLKVFIKDDECCSGRH